MINELKQMQQAAAELENKGYTVTIEPSPDSLPFDLGGYRPDLMAVKNGEGIIIEIKASLKRLPIQKYQDVADRVSSHSGWKFALITLDEPIGSVISVAEMKLPNREELREKLGDVETLVGMKMYSPALLSIWIQIESLLRIKVSTSNMLLNSLQPNRVINCLYSDGELSMSQFDKLKELMKLRNEVVHGFNVDVTEQQVRCGIALFNELIES